MLEKLIAVLRAIWIHKNNVIFKKEKCKPCFVLELAKKIVYETREYKRCTSLPISSKLARSDSLDADKSYIQQIRLIL